LISGLLQNIYRGEKEMEDNGMARGLGIGFLVGAMVGAAIGLLYAPQSGAQTRVMIMDKADEVKEKVSEAADMVREKVATMRGKATG
jgi:gas vesicle protein